MKVFINFIYCFLSIALIAITSCNKEYSCEGCKEDKNNKPPIAVAGPDQVITLQTDSVLLDGRSSSDPDGIISSYGWIKISGPASFSILLPKDSITTIKNLSKGVYLFELKVTDNGGLSAKDTVQIIVKESDNTETTILGCNMSMTAINNLPTSGMVNFSFAAGTKILFARGVNGIVDSYDTLTHQWKTVMGMNATSRYLHSQEGYQMAKAGSKVIFSVMADPLDPSKGQLINIYDTTFDSWKITHLNQARSFYAIAVAGNEVYYAGGNNNSGKMDVYDAFSDSWSVKDFAAARPGMSAIGFQDKIYFAGGFNIRNDSLVKVCDDYGTNCDSVPAWVATDRVDILDVPSNTWSVAHLSVARSGVVSTILENKIVFAGGETPYIDKQGFYNPIADFYNPSNNSWSSSWFGPTNTLMFEYSVYPWMIHSIGTKMLIQEGAYSDKIHIYDDITQSWSIAQMPYNHSADMLDRGKIIQIDNKLLFWGQYSDRSNNVTTGIDIYNSLTNSWCHTQLNFPIGRMGVVKMANSVFIAGGLGPIPPGSCCNSLVDTVWRLKF